MKLFLHDERIGSRLKQIKLKSNRGKMSARIWFSENRWKAVVDDDTGGLMNGCHIIYGNDEIDTENKARVFMKSILNHKN